MSNGRPIGIKNKNVTVKLFQLIQTLRYVSRFYKINYYVSCEGIRKMKVFMGFWLIQFALCLLVSFSISIGDIKEGFMTFAFIEIFISIFMIGTYLLCL